MSTQEQFLQQLQDQAQRQAKLNTQRVLPKQFDAVTSFIGNFPWQTILFLSLLTSILLEIWR